MMNFIVRRITVSVFAIFLYSISMAQVSEVNPSTNPSVQPMQDTTAPSGGNGFQSPSTVTRPDSGAIVDRSPSPGWRGPMSSTCMPSDPNCSERLFPSCSPSDTECLQNPYPVCSPTDALCIQTQDSSGNSVVPR